MDSLRIGSMLGRSLQIWLRNFLPFTLLGVVAYAPLLAYTFVVLREPTPERLRHWVFATAVGPNVLQQVATGMMAYGAFQKLRRRPAGMGATLGAGIERLFPSLLTGLVVGAILAIFFAPAAYGGPAMVLLIPGIVVICTLYVAVPAAILEGVGPGAALHRSRLLTSGHRGAIFGMLFLLGVVNRAVLYTIQMNTIGDRPTDLHQVKVFIWALLAFAIVAGGLQAVTNAVAYHDLRRMKDGVDADELARVFD
jgi:Na+-translocating ferredoxin:NAD+ oxidoreductase RnfD subunit